MRTKLIAGTLAVSHTLLFAQPSFADWRDTLIRSVAPTLVNRAVSYLLREKSPPRSRSAAQPVYQNYERPPEYKSIAEYQQPVLPEYTAPYVTPPPKPSRPAKNSAPKATKLHVPPPPKMMVPPPPPTTPMPDLFHMYPDLYTSALPSSPMPMPTPNTKSNMTPPKKAEPDGDVPIPKVAPDFRNARSN